MKERIIGAVVLVLVVVLVVPVFLDGSPGEDEIVSQAVSLPGQTDQKRQTVVLERDRETPVPVSAAEETAAEPPAERPLPEPVVAKPAEKPVDQAPPAQQDQEPAPAAAPAEADAAPPADTSTTGMWAVQLGSFGNQQNAERLAADLRKQGFLAFLSKLETSSGSVLHRVRVGPLKDRASAEAMAAKLAQAGHEGKVLPHP